MKRSMAGAPLQSRGGTVSGGTLGAKAWQGVSEAAKIFSIANGVRDAIPIVRGVARGAVAAAQYAWPFLV